MKNLNFHKLEDEKKLRFFQMPKVLFESELYKDLSLGAKAMYSVLRDRQDLSIKNKWVDEDGYIYLIYTINSLCELLNISDKTATKYKRELAKYELLFEKRMGQGKPNRLYVLKPNYNEADSYKKKADVADSELSYPQPQSIENTKNRRKYDSVNRTFYDSRLVESTTLEAKKVRPNDTEVNNTEFIDTHSINHSLNKYDKNPYNKEKENERKTEIELSKIIKQANIEEIFLKDYYMSVKKAVENLYYRNKPLIINDIKIPVSQIREDLKKLNFFHIETAIAIFKEQSANQKIVNRISYLSTCIYNSMFDMELKIENDLRYEKIIW